MSSLIAFNQALPFTLEFEGGFVDDPDDRGGRTNRGVTERVYREWKQDPTADVEQITDEEVRTIYRDRYWVPAHCDEFAWPVSMAHFDAAVNHGLKNAARILQRAVGVTDDGLIGPVTLEAVSDRLPRTVVERMLWKRLEFYEAITDGSASQRKFLRGWMKRVLKLRRAIEAA